MIGRHGPSVHPVASAGEPADFSHSAFYQRRNASPAFARAMRFALELGYKRIEMALLESFDPASYADDGHFLDVGTLANALFARAFSLASLSEFLEVDHRKLEFDDFDAPVSDEMIRYAVGDGQATWGAAFHARSRAARWRHIPGAGSLCR